MKTREGGNMGYTIDKKRLSRFMGNVRQEIKNIQFGEPQWRTGPPIHFEDNKAVPVLTVLERLQNAPSKENFDAFIAQATQDLGKPTGDGFLTWSGGIFTKVDDEQKPVVASKKFSAAIKDGLYDCFKVAHISMDQKQVDLMEKAAIRMANSFQGEISKAVGEQLEVLVERLKKAEVKPTTKPRAEKKAAEAAADDSK
jgi:hypothetical protein